MSADSNSESFRTIVSRACQEIASDIPEELEQGRSVGKSESETSHADMLAVELAHRLSQGDATSARDYISRYPKAASNSITALKWIGIEFHALRKLDPLISELTFQDRYSEWANHPEWENFVTHRDLKTLDQEAEVSTSHFRHEQSFNNESSVALTRWLTSILEPSSDPSNLGLLDGYCIQSILGKGGMGVVLKAWDQTLGRDVALKLLLPQAALKTDAKERFFREAKAAAAISHQRIVPIFAVREVNEIVYIVMPMLKGQTLGKCLTERKKLNSSVAIRYARETAEGLVVAHSRGLTHRDIKPDNIWLEETEDGSHVRILDFGLARGEGAQAITREGCVVGTPHYMAPEQITGTAPHPQFDLFSLGCVLYEMLAGKKPFNGPDLIAVLNAVSNYCPPPLNTINSDVTPQLSHLVEQLMEKDSRRRFPSAERLVAELRMMEGRHPDPDATIVQSSVPQCYAQRSKSQIVAMTIVATFVFAMTYAFGYIAKHAEPNSSEPTTTISAAIPPPSETRVKSFQINLFQKNPGDNDRDKGILGRQSFEAHVGDQVTLNVEFNHSVYAYLVSFRPDGVMELIHPDSENEEPPLSKEIRYPTTRDLGKRYGLQEGAGLWIFAVAASSQPLPPFKTWAAAKPVEWGSPPAKPGSVLYFDGLWTNVLTPKFVERAKGEAVFGTEAPFAVALRYLKKHSQATFIAGQGFAVQK